MRGLSTPRALAQRVVKGPQYKMRSMALRLGFSPSFLSCTKLVAVRCARLQDGSQDTLPTHPVCHGNHGLVVALEVRHQLRTENGEARIRYVFVTFFEMVRICHENVTNLELTFFNVGHNL